MLTPAHDGSWADLDVEQVDLVMGAMRERVEAHAGVEGVRYTQAIVNHGREAGASINHPHGQLLGIPFVPRDIAEEEAGFARFVGGCLMCTTLEAEVEAGHRTVLEDDLAVVVCPYWSGTPFELLVIPRAHEAHLGRAKPADVCGVGRALRTALTVLRERLGDVAYNVVFHTSPHGHDGEFHWHAHVLPKLTTRAGFELGTGVLINIVPPEAAADVLLGR
ncbi:MAG: Galactose-1-phosphate uridylyltransferase [uncultured Acidimicrobiales bacterium]|uniref:Galactose-1-phosphate uridylyltransferase n=1 Tax=uncultured Acidimicrobiales bacterium TaxID=310071 RepID=A0A6J4H154_9ACTN|nr:MAG: Galactose-1-phosphate uridylyltransferase [uncultured Acidimicrobiales bacterium]